MSFRDETDWVTGIYRVKDPIKNFKIRIRIKQEKSTFIPVPNFEDGGQISEVVCETENLFDEEQTFSWQEKVFSPFEIEHYKSMSNCHTPLEKQYHEEINKHIKKGVKNGRLFSYTDADNYLDYINDILNISSSKKILTPQQRHMSEIFSLGSAGLGLVNLGNNWSIVDYYPTKDKQNRARTLRGPGKYFFLMADLTDQHEKMSLLGKIDRREVCLCSLRFEPRNGILQATPAIDSFHDIEPRRIEIDGDTKNAYLYWIEHVDNSLDEIKKIHMKDTLLKGIPQHTEISHEDTDYTPISSFTSKNEKSFSLFIEIVSAEGFDDDNLLVHYNFMNSTDWTILGEINGTTQTCYTTSTGIAHFSTIFEIHLESSKEPNITSQLKLFFEIISVGWWKRQRIVGYCFLPIILEPGMKNYTLQTWRLDEAYVSRTSQLRRFFIGGDGQLDDLRNISFSKADTNEILTGKLSKLGLRSCSGNGTLNIRIYTVSHGKSSDIGHSKSIVIDSPGLTAKVEGVVEAFKRARIRMLKTSQKLGIATTTSEETEQ